MTHSSPTSAMKRRTGLRFGKLLKVLRRIHLYTGLFMFPWLLLFGASGMLFNHPNLGEQVKGERVPPSALAAVGFQPWDPAVVARQLVSTLNAQGHTQYALNETYESQFVGVGVLSAPGTREHHVVLAEPTRGAVLLTERAHRPDAPPPFEGRLSVEGYSMQTLEGTLAPLFAERRPSALGPLRAHPKIAPELRFQMRDDQGELWNVTYHTGSGEVSGRRVGVWSNLGFTQLLGMLHKTHHFTLGLSYLWFWALFEDLLGLTAIVWACSGLLMWWQMKPTRLIGMLAIGLSLSCAATVMWGTASHLMFGRVHAVKGPGE